METFQKLALQAPALVLMFFFVKMFLTAMRERDRAFLATIEKINQENIEARKLSRSTIEDNTKHTARCTSALATMTLSLQHFLETLNARVHDKRPVPTQSGPENG